MANQAAEASLDDDPAGRLAEEGPSLPAVWQQLSSGSNAIQAADRGLRQAESALRELRTDLQERANSFLASGSFHLSGYAERLQDAAASAGGTGVNLLVIAQGEEAVATLGAALTRSADGGLTLRSVDLDRSRTALFVHRSAADMRGGIIDRALDGCGDDAILRPAHTRAGKACSLDSVDAALAEVKTAFSLLSIARSRVGLQASFLAALSRELTAPTLPALSEPLDENALRRTALQTRQLLSEQTRSIASLNHQTVLKLFQPV